MIKHVKLDAGYEVQKLTQITVLNDNDNNENEANILLQTINTNNIEKQSTITFICNLINRKLYLWQNIPWCFVLLGFLQVILYALDNNALFQQIIFIYEKRQEYWRYVSYMLVHADLTHLLLNVLMQCLIGICLEIEQGHWRALCIFIAGGIAGSLATVMLQPLLSLLGASAGVYALLMSHVPHLIKNFTTLSYRYLRIICLCILCLSDVSFTVFHYSVNNNRNPRICLEAHLAGAACGLCLGTLIYTSDNQH